jgi:hypothetical protein
MDPIDDIVRDAMKALEASSTPRDYFDQLPERIHVRLEGSMQTEHQSDAHSTDGVVRAEASEENSGLHDIKALAHSTKTQVARRRATSQHEIDQTLLSHTQSGLHAVALPDPAKMVQLPSVEEARALARTTHGMAAAIGPEERGRGTEVDEAPARASAREPVAARGKGLPVWLWAGGGLAAAAAAVMAFVVLGKDTGKKAEEAAAPSADQAERAEPEPMAAAGSAAPTVQPLEEKAAEPAEKPDEGITTSGIAADPAPPPVLADDAKEESARSDRKKKDKGGDEADPDKAFKKDTKVKPDDKADDVVAPPKEETKKDVKKTEAEKKLEGAVLGKDDSDELGIGDALGGGGDKKDDEEKKTELTNQEVRDGLDAINGKAKACYGAHGQTGTVKVKLTIAPSGKVSKATASGDLAGTPAGDCVVSAVKSAEFPAWDGAPKSTSYVVLLSD